MGHHWYLVLLAALALSGAHAWGNCKDKYCSSCPNNPAVCEQCSGSGDVSGDSGRASVGRFYAGPDFKCHLCQDKTPHCELCNGRTGAPVQCSAGYGVKNGQCVFCTEDDCVSCSNNADRCTYCLDGGVDPATSKCLPCATGCAVGSCSSNRNACSSCKPGFTLSALKCARKRRKSSKVRNL